MIDHNDPCLTAYVLGELDETERQEIRAAIEASPVLQLAVRNIRETAGMLETEFASELNESVPAERVVLASQSESAPTKSFAGRRMAWIVAASLLVAATGLGLWSMQRPDHQGSRSLAQDSRDQISRAFEELARQPESGQTMRGQNIQGDLAEPGTNGKGLLASEATARQESLAELNKQLSAERMEQQMSQGGITEKDFEPLMKLIRETMKEDSWTETGSGESFSPNLSLSVSNTQEIQNLSGSANGESGQELPSAHYFKDDIQYGLSRAYTVQVPTTESTLADFESKLRARVDPSGTREIVVNEDYDAAAQNNMFGVVSGVQIEGKEIPEFQKNAGVTDLSAETEKSGGVDGQAEAMMREMMRGARGGRGRGEKHAGERYDPIIENDFLRPSNAPLSTFSIDVDTASYSKVRMYLKNYRQLPPPGAVRIEELVNYFGYNYAPPTDDVPFAAHQTVAACPWNPQHKLVRVAIKGREIAQDKRPVSNLVFLLDVSGSMNESNKLPLVKRGIQMLIDQLSENDRVAMVVYAGAAGTVLDSTTGDHKDTILGALDRLQAGGSTNGGDGIRLAYQIALDNFITGGVNRVILCTDGDFNVGTTSNDELVALVEEKAKNNIFLSVLGFGMGNLNDSMLEQISNKGNGNYAFIDTDTEARKVLVEQMSGTLVTIAKDVKIQVEFNPARVAAYRLVGYENRVMAAQDFNNDKKDAGEIGAGHTVTAIYEVVPSGMGALAAGVDELKYQEVPEPKTVEDNGELLTLKLRYKQPEGDVSQLLTFPLMDSDRKFVDTDRDFQLSAAVASFGMLLRGSKYAGNATYDSVLETAMPTVEAGDESGYRAEFLELVRIARELAKNRSGK